MKMLLVSDTHGKLDAINKLVEKTKANLVIHAGDFGFYYDSSYRRLYIRKSVTIIIYSYEKVVGGTIFLAGILDLEWRPG